MPPALNQKFPSKLSLVLKVLSKAIYVKSQRVVQKSLSWMIVFIVFILSQCFMAFSRPIFLMPILVSRCTLRFHDA